MIPMTENSAIDLMQDLPYRRGVGIVLFNKEGLVFCGERSDMPGAWQMPQGGVQRDEELTIAVLRELKEEIGTDHARIIGQSRDMHRYDFPDYLHLSRALYKGKYRGQQQNWFALLFEGQDKDIDLALHDEVEFSQWKWVELPALSSMIVSFKRPMYEALAREFADFPAAIRAGKYQKITK